MGYLAPAELRQAIARDPNAWKGTAASMDDPELQSAIDGAQSVVDGRLSVRYRVPFDPVPALVASIVADIAVYRATLHYRGSKDLAAYDPVVLRHADALALLKDIVAGRANLTELDGDAAPEGDNHGGVGAPVNRYTGRLFGTATFGLGCPPSRGSSFNGR